MSDLRYPLAALGLVMGSLPCVTWAQQAPIFEEVLVTAEKRTESLQDLSQAVTALSAEDVENRIESFRKQLKTGVNHFRGDRWERVIQVPDAGACKTVHNVDTKFLGSASGVIEFFNRPFVDPIRIAVSPNVLGKNRLMTFVDVIEDSLSYKVGADGVALEFVTVQQFPLLLDIVVICQCLVDFEMVAPACEFDSIVSEFMGHPCHGFDRQISPLASE